MNARSKKHWTEKEIDFLREYWGTYSVPTIANKLNRSINSVIEKARALKLGPQTECSDMISIGLLFRELHIESSYGWNFNRMKAAGLKVRTKKLIKSSYRMVRIQDFWDFAEKNQDMFDFAPLEENVFGEEPAWVKVKRTKDFELRKARVKYNSHWTDAENRELRDLLKMHMYTAEELAKRFRRSPDAVRQHAATLSVEDRPFCKERRDAWSENDICRLNVMVKEGKTFKEMSVALGRTRKAVKGKLYSIYSTESIEKIRPLLEQQEMQNAICLDVQTPEKEIP